MSEPRASADSLETLLPGLRHYQVEDDRIDFRSDAYVVASEDGVILIDPLPLSDEGLASIGTIAAIVLTAPSHQRSAWRFRRATGARVYAPRGAEGLLEAADVGYAAGDPLPGGLTAVHAPGPVDCHHALHLDQGDGALLLGDLLLCQPDGLVRHLTSDHLSDPEKARDSVRNLLALRFDLVGFAHGRPIVADGRAALEAVAARDAAGT